MTSLSVIVPSRDSGPGLLPVLEAIFAALPAESEVLLVDDGSRDGSGERAREVFPGVRYYRSPEPRGAAAARNLGIDQSRGGILAFVDSDVTVSPDAFRLLLEGLRDADIAHALPYLEGKVPMFEPRIARRYPVITALFAIRRAALERLDGPFDESYEIYNEDLDFFLRCRLAGLRARLVEGSLATHPLKGPADPGRRYHLDLRSSLYGAIKFSFTRVRVAGFGSVHLVLENARVLLANRDFRHPGYFQLPRRSLPARIFGRLFPEHRIHPTRILGVRSIASAIGWNLRGLGRTLAEKRRLEAFYGRGRDGRAAEE